MAKTLNDRLRERMELLGLKAGGVADQAGVGHSFVYDILLGRSVNPTTEKLNKIASVLKTDVGYLMYGTKNTAPMPRVKISTQTVLIPFIKVEAAMGGPMIVDAEEQGEPWRFPKKWLRDHLHCQPAGLRLIGVTGDSMEPTLKAKDMVMLDTAQTQPTPPGVFALHDGLGLMVKRIEPVANDPLGRLRVSSDNTLYQPYEKSSHDIRIIGRVVWFSRGI